jgi:hypothetical protein
MMMVMNEEVKTTWKENNHGLLYGTIPACPTGTKESHEKVRIANPLVKI